MLRQQSSDQGLVFGIGIGIKQANGHALHARGLHPLRNAHDLRLVEWRFDRARRQDPLLNAEAPRSRHQYRARLSLAGIDVAPEMPTDLEHVLEACGRD